MGLRKTDGRTRIVLLGLVASVALGGAACTGDDPEPTQASTPTVSATEVMETPTATEDAMVAATETPRADHMDTPSTETGAAELRATLTALLQEHVYLAGSATGAALSGGDFEGAAAALDANSQDLAGAIGSVHGVPAGESFLELWRAHIGMFADYTQAVAGGDQVAATAALAELDGYRTDFGAFLESANPNLPREAVAEELIPHVESLVAAIDAQAAGDADAFTLLREAAGHMPHTANVLAGAIVAQMPEQFAGN
ncbi:MAG: hypothetical protein GEU80_03610 [Dehalococcoidia bacterium]|nr:hypothetical protein [Dehalococcoidia bacterium]